MISTAEELRANPDLLKAYQQWKHDAITEAVIGIIMREIRPAFPSPEYITGEMGLALHGNQCGAHFVLDRLRSLDAASTVQQGEPEAEFGARDFLQERGLLKKEGA